MKAALPKPRVIIAQVEIAQVEASGTAAATGLLIVKVPLGNVPSTLISLIRNAPAFEAPLKIAKYCVPLARLAVDSVMATSMDLLCVP
jgi:hypothetical protein